MPFDAALLKQYQVALKNADRILVVTHQRPDGDAIGSLLGLGLALQSAGKDVQMVSVDGVPSSLRHLPGSEQVMRKPHHDFNLVCVVDCSDLERAGVDFDAYGQPDINIDHHITNLNFARINIVEYQAVATTEIIADLLLAQGYPLEQPVTNALLTGLITDTIGFRTSNITPKAMRLAADLMESGLNMPELYRKALLNKSFEAAQLWGAGLSKLEREGPLVWTTLTNTDREKARYTGRDDADLVNVLSAINGAAIAMIFMEQENNSVKVSWRSQPGIDVSQIALSFGGGGHPAASGADIPGNLSEVLEVVLERTRLLVAGVAAGDDA